MVGRTNARSQFRGTLLYSEPSLKPRERSPAGSGIDFLISGMNGELVPHSIEEVQCAFGRMPFPACGRQPLSVYVATRSPLECLTSSVTNERLQTLRARVFVYGYHMPGCSCSIVLRAWVFDNFCCCATSFFFVSDEESETIARTRRSPNKILLA